MRVHDRTGFERGPALCAFVPAQRWQHLSCAMARSGTNLAGLDSPTPRAALSPHELAGAAGDASPRVSSAASSSCSTYRLSSITVGTRSRSPCRHTERRHGPGTAPSNPSARRIVTTRVSLSRRPLTCSRCVLGYAAETDARRSRRRFSTEKHCWHQKVASASP